MSTGTDSNLYRRASWEAQPDQLAYKDKITVRNLQVSVNAGVDVWGRPKKQRALLTVTLSLAKPFDSAAEADALDKSTVHYGKLSKDIQAHIERQVDHGDSQTLAENICDVARSTAGDTSLASVEVEVFYPKGSMFGDGAGFSLGTAYPSQGPERKYGQLHLRNVRIPCLIGVNSNERLQKQPVVVNIWIECVGPAHPVDEYQELEAAVVDVVSGSSFETLETLTTAVIHNLRQTYFKETTKRGLFIRLRIEKPHAVPAADAPVVEIYRPVYI